jgi:hypothetical protein
VQSISDEGPAHLERVSGAAAVDAAVVTDMANCTTPTSTSSSSEQEEGSDWVFGRSFARLGVDDRPELHSPLQVSGLDR